MRTVNPERHEKRRREILRAAQKCFAAAGLGASIASICAEAGMSPGHLYHYFTSKEAILDGLFQLVLAETTARLASDDNVPALVADLYSSGKGPSLLFDLLAESERNSSIADRLHHHSTQMKLVLAGAIERGQADGTIDATWAAGDLATLVLAALDGSKAIRLRDPQIGRARTQELLVELVARVLRRGSGTKVK